MKSREGRDMSNKALQMSESNEWYTPTCYIEAARSVMGSIDLDPASCEFANERVKATTFYDVHTNGLHKPWHGRVWLNPPYGTIDGKSNQERWSCHLIAQYEAGITTEAILLVNAVTGNSWFQRLWNYPICFTNHRIRFYNANVLAGQPTHSNVFVYFGKKHTRFTEVFSQFGRVVPALPPEPKTLDLWEVPA
jgi:DNA N-6-adenine-methyltransferase (Dam)